MTRAASCLGGRQRNRGQESQARDRESARDRPRPVDVLDDVAAGGDRHRPERDVGPQHFRRGTVDRRPPAGIVGIHEHDEAGSAQLGLEPDAVGAKVQDAAPAGEGGDRGGESLLGDALDDGRKEPRINADKRGFTKRFSLHAIRVNPR